MKKLLFVLLVVALASYLLVGCLPVTPPAEGEGEGEGECEVVVSIDGAVIIDGKTYVSAGNHDITVTFCSPIVGYADAYIACCTGDYSKLSEEVVYLECGAEVVLFPNADKKVWTGSGYFGCMNEKNLSKAPQCPPCCASYVEIYAGECVDEACIWFPVIVDSCPPYAEIEITADACECEGCEITFETIVGEFDCEADEECCGDDCSGLASWSVVLYGDYPFDSCCDPSICEEPISSCSGTACPIECTTECLVEGTYYAVVTLIDNVGLEEVYYAEIVLGADCNLDVTEGMYVGPEYVGPSDCILWNIDTTDTIGYCYPICIQQD